ncbi:hypothetical protein GCM10011584_08360 [Nocardioides phosphati]|uniref:Choice-of-anchor G family protein n=1 Tax=Nocardioides phosphati TaxID=1867775 RepID=A0ABQ2N7P9_9ACTN|nr:choice-of-anchor G family protein [Nocardioides phosphati]GGO86324.1 hypothetical protein GCM10011584_08360 [Nocardioides phosphati]
MFDLSATARRSGVAGNWKKGLAITAAGALAVVIPVMPAAQAAGADEPGGASASVFESGIGSLPIASAASSEASSETNPGPNRSGLNATALGRATIKIAGVDVPLSDFIDFGQAGALYSESAATTPFDARSISGTLSSDGSIQLDRADGGFAPVTVDLLSVLKKVGVSGLTDSLVNKADLRLGIGGAEVIAKGGDFLDPDGVGGPGRYRVGQADLDLGSPVVKGASATLYDAAGRMQTAFEGKVNDLIDKGAVASRFPAGTTVDADVHANFQDKVMKAILAQPITTKNHIITVDFSTGVMTIHLDQVLHGQETVDGPLLPAQDVRPGDPTGLNNQNPNTEIVDDEIYPMVAESIHDLMDEVYNIAAGVVVGSLDSTTVDWTATTKPDADNSAVTTWSTTLRGTTTKAPSCVATGPNGPALCDAQTGVVKATTWADPLKAAYDYWTADNADQLFRLAVDDLKTGMITVPLRNAVAPFLDVLAKVVSLQVNHQETRTCTMADGTKGINRLRVSAVSLAVLRNANGAVLNLGNAGSRVAACTPMVQASVVSVGGNQPLAEEGYSEADPGTNPGPNQGGVDPSVLNTRTIKLGGADIPLDQFINYGQLATMLSESTATTPNDGRAITGAAGADGSIELDSLDGTTFDPATIDVLSVLRKAGASGLSDLAVDQLLLKLGIGGSELQAVDGRFTDPDGVGGPGRYRIAQADLDLH